MSAYVKSDHFLPDRRIAVNRLAATSEVDVLIVGAGINGSATFRDLARNRKHSVALVDRVDFGAGASMASSRMAHGGLRYLENGEFRLTREAVRERNLLLKHAPNAVTPLKMAIPFPSYFAGLGTALRRAAGLGGTYASRGALMTKVGLSFYDWFARKNPATPKHGMQWGRSAKDQFPDLPNDIKAVATYYDGLIEAPERIALSLVADGLKANDGTQALNHCRLKQRQGDKIFLEDTLDGQNFEIKPRIVINAAGAWIDDVNRLLGESTDFIQGAKGSHLVFDHPDLLKAHNGCGFVFDDRCGRVCLSFPFEGKVIVGSTDIPVTSADNIRCTEEEETYLLKAANVLFPEISVRASHIAHRFAGVRPLAKSDAATPGQASRDHKLHHSIASQDRPFELYSLAGGKWTTFRAFAEEVTNAVLAADGLTRSFDTKTTPAGDLFSNSTPAGTDRISRDYGPFAAEIRDAAVRDPGSGMLAAAGFSTGEIRHLIRNEMAATLDDVLLRRTRLGLNGCLTPDLIRLVAEILGEETGKQIDCNEFIAKLQPRGSAAPDLHTETHHA